MFSKAKNVLVGGQASFFYNDIKYMGSASGEPLDEGIRFLLPRVVTGAMHNSGERFDAPVCHPDTRTAIQEDILQWADEHINDCRDIVTWLCGPAGAGKSAIAQTIAQKLHARGRLIASFFFSRASGVKRRGEETYLVATLAHQISLNIPATKSRISAAIRENPLIFDLALQDQVDALIVAPLLAVYDGSTDAVVPRVMVVDGLDECRKENNAQRRVVDALIWGLAQLSHHNHKLFITSRPEHNIVPIFKNYEEGLVRRIELNDRWTPSNDIRTFLNAGFADIRRNHFYFQSHPVDRTWPRFEDVEILVRRSSGQFIYASVVLKYIKSEENYNPVARLQTILQLNNNGDQPYIELDALYESIFRQTQSVDRVLAILSLDQMRSKLPWTTRFLLPLDTFLPEFTGVDMDEIKFWLVPLASLLVWDQRPGMIHYMHASLPDFLLNPSRSNIFCINNPTIATGIVRRAMTLAGEGNSFKASADSVSLHLPLGMETGFVRQRYIPMSVLLGIPPYYANMLPPDQKHYIHSLVSNFNVVETVLREMSNDSGVYASEMFEAVVAYLNWVLTESEDESASKLLCNPVAQIQTWLVNQFAQLDNYLNNEKIDLWPFLVTNKSASMKKISGDFSLALEVCRSTTSENQRLWQTTTVEVSSQVALLCRLMRYIPRWLERRDLLGRHAMTTDRYGVALQRIAYYLLQLPKDILAEILNDSSNEEDILQTPIMRLVCKVLPTFLMHAPRSPDLYFLVALAEPVMAYVIMYGNPYVSTYLKRALKEFPFLKEPTSSDYIHARLKVTEACIRLEIQTDFHELVDEMDMTDEELVQYKELLRSFAVLDRRVPVSEYIIDEKDNFVI